LNPGEVAVKSSNTTYCTRYYINNGLNVVDNDTTSAGLTQDEGDYKYFDYTCYASYGWYGNIGIILEGGNDQTDKICQGDPTSANESEIPVISGRRVYRGMYYEVDTNKDSGKVEDTNGVPLYWSIGIGEGVKLGPAEAADGTPTGTADGISHDFVVSSMQTSALTGDYCTSLGVLIRTDSTFTDTNGDTVSIFQEMPNDFYCLNPYVDTSVLVSPPEAIDTASCPFNPSIAIIKRYAVTAYGLLGPPVPVSTSDGPDNCFATDTSDSYICYGYDRENGWTGYVQADIEYDLYACALDRSYYSELTANTEVNFGCVAGQSAVVRGPITLINAELTGITLDMEREMIPVAGGAAEFHAISNTCEINVTKTNFSCVTGNLDIAPPTGYTWTETNSASAWSASLNADVRGYVCNDDDGDGLMPVADPVDPTVGIYSQPIIAARNENSCP
jgi:hypothetical protein